MPKLSGNTFQFVKFSLKDRKKHTINILMLNHNKKKGV